MVRPVVTVPEAVDGLPGGHVPSPTSTSPGDGRERILDVLRANGSRFRAGARWRFAL
ncbi:hypothetical protein [Micromonospora halophytica]|uniref:Uncharacterized protein n=1 Tax=Micromonospora halophytica TaxID=47864 RepID=A0A1C5HSK0_9ACTN|nr:hypothetical protein [Micromonospora halophytica]SCG48989.1 hypothetical protein GA0070560_105342 [Micromonospora halophytica]